MLPSLADVQGQDFDTPQILIAERVGGMEDIPVRICNLPEQLSNCQHDFHTPRALSAAALAAGKMH